MPGGLGFGLWGLAARMGLRGEIGEEGTKEHIVLEAE